MARMIYSDTVERMVLSEVKYKNHKWIWNEADGVYYRDDTDEIYMSLDFADSITE